MYASGMLPRVNGVLLVLGEDGTILSVKICEAFVTLAYICRAVV